MLRAGAALAAAAILALLTLAASAAVAVDDPYFANGDEWALTGAPASINAPAAWCAADGGGVTVAVIDTGADFGHPDLAGKLVAGARFLNGNGDPAHPDAIGQDAVADDNGHGTLVAGLVGALTNNGVGIAAVAPAAKILVVKALDHGGRGNSRDVAAAIRWAVSNGASVVNLSLGSDVPIVGDVEGAIPAAIDWAHEHGAAVAIAAGNSALPTSGAQLTKVESEALVVGATGRDGRAAYYSTTGSGVNIYAPGGDDTQGDDARGLVISTARGGGYAFNEGTSFATPQVAGTLALLISAGRNNDQARQQVLTTAANRNGLAELDAGRALGGGGACPPGREQSEAAATSGSGVHNTAPAYQPFTGGAPPATAAPSAGGQFVAVSPPPIVRLATTAAPLPGHQPWAAWAALAVLSIAAGSLTARLRFFRPERKKG
jgi:subtilisin family serine protease